MSLLRGGDDRGSPRSYRGRNRGPYPLEARSSRDRAGAARRKRSCSSSPPCSHGLGVPGRHPCDRDPCRKTRRLRCGDDWRGSGGHARSGTRCPWTACEGVSSPPWTRPRRLDRPLRPHPDAARSHDPCSATRYPSQNRRAISADFNSSPTRWSTTTAACFAVFGFSLLSILTSSGRRWSDDSLCRSQTATRLRPRESPARTHIPTGKSCLVDDESDERRWS